MHVFRHHGRDRLAGGIDLPIREHLHRSAIERRHQRIDRGVSGQVQVGGRENRSYSRRLLSLGRVHAQDTAELVLAHERDV